MDIKVQVFFLEIMIEQWKTWTRNSLYQNVWWWFSRKIPNKCLGFGYKGLVYCRNNDWLMENMDKGLNVPKWVLKNRPKYPKCPKNLSAQFVCPSPKVLDFNEKSLHWASVVRAQDYWDIERELPGISQAYRCLTMWLPISIDEQSLRNIGRGRGQSSHKSILTLELVCYGLF